MHNTETIWQSIGALQTGHAMTNRRLDDLRREFMVHLAMLHRKQRNGNGRGRRAPWMQIAAMGTVALTSILGLVKPEAAAALIRALLH